MTEQSTEQLSRWLDEALAIIDERRPASVHLDDLLGEAAYQSDPTAVAQAAFVSGVDLLGVRSDCSLILCWPCGIAEHIDIAVPEKLSVHGDGEPPSLILLHSRARMLYEVVEEYRKPVDARDYGFNSERIFAYYRCFRGSEAIMNDWEYSRALYFEGIDPALRA